MFALRLPPPRERHDDNLLLTGRSCRSADRRPPGISRDARQMRLDYHWPGNVRELAERARADGAGSASADLEPVERTMIEKALQEARFNKSDAARALGSTRSQLYVRLRKHGLE